MKVRYVGPFAAVEVAAVGLVCKSGDTIDVPDDVAESLLAQADNWQSAKPAAKGKES